MREPQVKTVDRFCSVDETIQRLGLFSERFELFTRRMVQVAGSTRVGLRSVVNPKVIPKMK